MSRNPETLRICLSCGALGAHAEHAAGETLFAALNAARDEAGQAGRYEIDVVTLVVALSRLASARDDFSLYEIDANALVAEASAVASRRSHDHGRGTAGNVRLSAGLAGVIRLAGEIARRRLARAATASDVLLACLQSQPGDPGIDLVQHLVSAGRSQQRTQVHTDTSGAPHQVLAVRAARPENSYELLARQLRQSRADTARLQSQPGAIEAALAATDPAPDARPHGSGTAAANVASHTGASQPPKQTLLASRAPMFQIGPVLMRGEVLARGEHAGAPERSAADLAARDPAQSRTGIRRNQLQHDGGSYGRVARSQKLERTRVAFESLRNASGGEGAASGGRSLRDLVRTRTRQRQATSGLSYVSSAKWSNRRQNPDRYPERAPRAYAGYASPDFAKSEHASASRQRHSSEKRFYLAPGDDIVDAPSIGSRTAERLRAAGVRCVRDLLDADAANLAIRLKARSVGTATITAWQHQARLVIAIPFLRGSHAQLLAGAGYVAPEAIAAADSNTLMAAILRFAATREGQSVLRAGPPPDIEKIVSWTRNAAEAEVERAA